MAHSVYSACLLFSFWLNAVSLFNQMRVGGWVWMGLFILESRCNGNDMLQIKIASSKSRKWSWSSEPHGLNALDREFPSNFQPLPYIHCTVCTMIAGQLGDGRNYGQITREPKGSTSLPIRQFWQPSSALAWLPYLANLSIIAYN